MTNLPSFIPGKILTMKTFPQRIEAMNNTFKLPTNSNPTDQGNKRLRQIIKVLQDEVSELEEALYMEEGSMKRFIAIADCLGDLNVYIRSEALRWGLPHEEVLDAIMDSQESKLVDGKPLMAEDGSKFIKGPNYIAPEPRIQTILEKYIDA
jgi:hypothetical protein